MPTLRSLASANPPTRVPQDKLRELAGGLFLESDPRLARVLSVFDNAGIDERAFAMPLEWYFEPHGFKDRSAAYAAVGLELAQAAAEQALARAGLAPRDVDAVLFASTTGIATPSLDARLATAAGLREDVLRLPVWGWGCAGGVAALARAADLARARPEARVLVVCLELCSLAFDLRRADKKTLVAASLFADGCAAAVVAGDEAEGDGPNLGASASWLFPRTERVMGWDVEDETLDVVFSPGIPDLVRAEAAGVVEPFLARHLGRRPQRWILHPGGAKVLEAWAASLDLPPAALDDARATLRAHGNMSSATILYALERALQRAPLAPGETALLASLGPGFAVELALLEGSHARR